MCLRFQMSLQSSDTRSLTQGAQVFARCEFRNAVQKETGLESWSSITFQEVWTDLHENTAGCSFKDPLTWSLRFKNSVPNLFLDSVNFSFLNFFLRCFWTHARHFPQVRHLGACYLAPSMHRIPGGQEMVRTKTKWPSYDSYDLKSGCLKGSQEAKLASRSVLQPPNPQVSDCCDVVVCWADQVPHCFQLRIDLPYPGAKLWQVCRDSWFCCASLCVFMYFLHIWPTLSSFVRFPRRFWHSTVSTKYHQMLRCRLFQPFLPLLEVLFLRVRSSLSIRFFGARVIAKYSAPRSWW